MSASDDIVRRGATIYDDMGRTRIPTKVREEMGLKSKDKIEMLVIGDSIIIKKIEDDE